MNSKQVNSVDYVIQYVCDGESDFELSDDDSDVELDRVEHVQDDNQNNETLFEHIILITIGQVMMMYP